jgi:hypothetical protein
MKKKKLKLTDYSITREHERAMKLFKKKYGDRKSVVGAIVRRLSIKKSFLQTL